MQGHIRKRNNSYQFTVELGRDPLTGKRKQKTKSGFKTKKECQKAMQELIVQLERGEYFELSNILYKEYLSNWLSDYAKNNVAARTYKRYSDDIKRYIEPNLGNIPLNKIKPLHIQDFYNYCINKIGISSTTTLHLHAIIHKSLSQAVKWQLININPADAVEKPKKAKIEFTVWDKEDADKALDRIKDMTLYLPVLLALTTGMRRGEICGLQWDNVDLENKVIYIKKQLQKIDGNLKLVHPKTKGSIRKIVLLDYIMPILKNERKKQLENKLFLGEEYKDGNFVYQQIDGKPYDPEYVTRNFNRIINKISKELNINKIRFHDLRHTHATLLLKAGVNPKIVSERLGHSNISITLDTYTHVLPDMQKEAAEKLNNLLAK